MILGGDKCLLPIYKRFQMIMDILNWITAVGGSDAGYRGFFIILVVWALCEMVYKSVGIITEIWK